MNRAMVAAPAFARTTLPHHRRPGIEIQHAIFSRQIVRDALYSFIVLMIRRQRMEAPPYFGQSDGADKKPCWVLNPIPSHESVIGQRFFGFADRIGIQHEVQNWKGSTKSSGIRGGSQSVVRRTESCHASSFFMRRRAATLRRAVRDALATPGDGRASNQPSNSLAWRADSFLTFITASSTALMPFTLARK